MYKQLTHFEASGSITYPALSFLWQRATALQTLRITNSIVLEVRSVKNNEFRIVQISIVLPF
jgi:hypothetical protein